MHTYTCTGLHTRSLTHTRKNTQTLTNTYRYTNTCTHMQTHVAHTQTQAHVHTFHLLLLNFQSPEQMSLLPGSLPRNLKYRLDAFAMIPMYFVLYCFHLSTLFCNCLFTCLVPLTRLRGKDGEYTVYHCSPGV